jgi:metallo-beta-lactamase family protein
MALRLSFYGGAGTVTGSRFLLEQGSTRLLVDCGLFQGLKELRLLNWERPRFDPRSVEAVVLTHAHIDHSGYLPRLVRDGYRGPIYCSDATRELVEILLLDSARLQEEDAEYANRKGFSKHRPALPLYTVRDAERAIGQLKSRAIGSPFPAGSFEVRLHRSGHILGASYAEVRGPAMDGTNATLVFSGDLGQYNAPLHPDPAALVECDTLVLESTYGDRLHPETPLEEQLRVPFERTLSGGGVVLIPAFAVARAQLVLLLLRGLMDRGLLPEVQVHLDSPMAIEVTGLYASYAGAESIEIERRDLFGRWVRYHRTVSESQALNDLRGPRIIVAASGMMTGGRVLHHLKRLLPDQRNLIVLVGYQAAGTRGRRLLEGEKYLRIHGHDVPVRAPFIQVEGLSAHADAADLERWVASAPRKPSTIFLAHGEPQALGAMEARLRTLGLKVIVPRLNQQYELGQAGAWGDAS